MPSQVRLSKIRWRNAWPTSTGRNMSSQTESISRMTRFVHLPPAPLERVAVADARLKYKDEIDRARRNRTRRNVAIRAKHGVGSLNFSESLGFGRAATETLCPRGQPVPPTLQWIPEETAFIPHDAPPPSPAPKSCWKSFRPIGSTFGRCVFAQPTAPFLRVAITRPTLRFVLPSRNVRECSQQEVRCSLTTLISKPLSNA